MSGDLEQIKCLIDEARREGFVIVRPSDAAKLRPLTLDGVTVGFHGERVCAYGRRLGPLFVTREHRRKGLVRALYESQVGPLVACVSDNNAASIALHEALGFVRWRRYSHGWWWRRE